MLKFVFIISYDNDKFITFEEPRMYKGVDFAKKIKEKITRYKNRGFVYSDIESGTIQS